MFHRVRSVRSQEAPNYFARSCMMRLVERFSWTWVIWVNSMLNFDVQSLWARWQQGLVKLTLLFRILKLAGLAKILHQHLYFRSSNCSTDGIKIPSPWPNSDVRNQFCFRTQILHWTWSGDPTRCQDCRNISAYLIWIA